MKIAVIADIHGNLPALEAVLNDINKRSVDKIICLGDLAGKGPNSRESVDICRQECDIVIKGNWDDALYRAYIDLEQGQGDKVDDRARWYINSMDAHHLEYLGSLPHSTEFYLGGKLTRLFHAHPKNFNRYYWESPLEQRLELFDFSDFSEIKEKADIAIYADIHYVYMQILNGRHLINTGSVGNPLDTIQASYIILEGDKNDNSSFGMQFVRVTYDIEKTVAMAIKANVPDLDGYISELRTATYFRRH